MLFRQIALTGITLFLLGGCQSPEQSPPLQVETSNKKTIKEERVHHIIFFEFNSSTLPSNYSDILTSHANYLIANPNEVVLVEGYADEIGSRDFNFKLGMKRANAVKEKLKDMGVSDRQLITQSAGEMVPMNHEKGTESEQRNRRVALYY